jgi:hypothetical protein
LTKDKILIKIFIVLGLKISPDFIIFRRLNTAMTVIQVEQHNSDSAESDYLLPGYIRFYFKNQIEYAHYQMDTYKIGDKVHHHGEYLGRVVNKDESLFFNNKRGYFNFTLDKGLVLRPDLIPEGRPESLRLRFGDIWVYSEILRKTGFSQLIENLVPSRNDTLNSIIAFRLSNPDAAYCYAQSWYDRSYAKVLYPDAAISSSSISVFLENLGDELNYREFTSLYLDFLNKDKQLSEIIQFPILIDSTGMPNEIKIDKTNVSNHSGVINNEIRLIYVVDSDSGLPIYFKPISGNIIDQTTLKTTLSLLKANNINIKFIIMDAGYSSKTNLNFLRSLNIPFITRLSDNLTEYKLIIDNYSEKLFYDLDKVVIQNERSIYCQQIDIKIDEKHYYAYLCIDTDKYMSDFRSNFAKYSIGDFSDKNIDEYKINIDIVKNKMKEFGRFILISNENIDTTEIIGKYYIRQGIEHIFDVSKNNGSLLPLRVHSEETLRGHLLINFIVTIITLFINKELKDIKINSYGTFFAMKSLYINIFESIKIIDEPTKSENDIIESLNLETPFQIEKRISKNPKLQLLRSRRKKGRPKGSFGKPKKYKQVEETIIPAGNTPDIRKHCSNNCGFQVKRSRGRPKGAANKPKQDGGKKSDGIPVPQVKRSRGRPRGAADKPKTSPRD